MRSRRPSASARSISAASRLAWSELPFVAFGGTAWSFAERCGADRAGTARGCRDGFAAPFLGEDIDLIAFLHDLVFAQLELAVGDAFTCLHVVLIAMPGADEMHLAFGEIEALGCLIGQDALFHLGDGQA